MIRNITSKQQYGLGCKNKHTKKYVCEHCKEIFEIHSGEVLYKDGQFVFCCYNHRSEWRKKNVRNV